MVGGLEDGKVRCQDDYGLDLEPQRVSGPVMQNTLPTDNYCNLNIEG